MTAEIMLQPVCDPEPYKQLRKWMEWMDGVDGLTVRSLCIVVTCAWPGFKKPSICLNNYGKTQCLPFKQRATADQVFCFPEKLILLSLIKSYFVDKA